MKSIFNLLQEAEEDQEEMEVEVDTTAKNIRNPSFVFEVIGDFDYKELERAIQTNEEGLMLDTIELKIDTKGLVDDQSYEDFINLIEKLKYLNFVR